MFDELLAIGEAAKRLGVSQDTLRNWEENGKLVPERTAGGHRRYRLSDLKLIQFKEGTATATYRKEFEKLLADPTTTPRLRRIVEAHLMSYEELIEASLTRLADQIDRAQDDLAGDTSRRPVTPLGLPDIDRALGGGIRGGWLGMITGPPCSFKSTLAQQIAVQTAGGGHGTMLFALEMTRAKTLERLVAQTLRIPLAEVGQMISNDVDATIGRLPQNLVVLDNPAVPEDEERDALTPKWIEALVKAASVEECWDGERPRLVVIDSLMLVQPDGRWKAANRGMLVMEQLFMLAKSLDVGIIVTCPASKGNTPRGSYGQIDFCDFVLGLNRDDHAKLNVSLLKNRYGTDLGVSMTADPSNLYLTVDGLFASPVEARYAEVCQLLGEAARLNRAGDSGGARILLGTALAAVRSLVPYKFSTLEHGDKLVRETFKRGHDNPLTLPRRTKNSPDFYPEWRWETLDSEYRIVDGEDVASA